GMPFTARHFVMAALIVLMVRPGGRASAGENVDGDGDPLPEGAIARLGTKRLRAIRDAVFAPDGKTLVTTGSSSISLCDVRTGKLVRRFRYSENGWGVVAVSPDGRLIVSGGPENSVCLWDMATGKEVRRLEGPKAGV